jgi:hypothetical protein
MFASLASAVPGLSTTNLIHVLLQTVAPDILRQITWLPSSSSAGWREMLAAILLKQINTCDTVCIYGDVDICQTIN